MSLNIKQEKYLYLDIVFRPNVGPTSLQSRPINPIPKGVAGLLRQNPTANKLFCAQGLREGLAPRGPNELFGLGEPRSPEASSHLQTSVQQQPTPWSPIGSGGGGGQQQVCIKNSKTEIFSCCTLFAFQWSWSGWHSVSYCYC